MVVAAPMARLDGLHKKYSPGKTREAEDMGNYSQYLYEKGYKIGFEIGLTEVREKFKLGVLERMDALHYSDEDIMKVLKIDSDRLKFFRIVVQEMQSDKVDD